MGVGNSITRNSDGTYTSAYGYTVTEGADGRLWTGGAPSGYRVMGTSVVADSPQPAPNPWFGAPAPAAAPAPGPVAFRPMPAARPGPRGPEMTKAEVAALMARPLNAQERGHIADLARRAAERRRGQWTMRVVTAIATVGLLAWWLHRR